MRLNSLLMKMLTYIFYTMTSILLWQVSASFFEEFDEPEEPVDTFGAMFTDAIDDVSQKINCALASIKIALSLEDSPNPCSVTFNELNSEPLLEVPHEKTNVVITTTKVIHMEALGKETEETFCKMLGSCNNRKKTEVIKIRLKEVCVVIITEIEKFSFDTRRKFEFIEEELKKPTIKVIFKAIKLLHNVSRNATDPMATEVAPVFHKSLEILHLNKVLGVHANNKSIAFPESYESFAKKVFVEAALPSTVATVSTQSPTTIDPTISTSTPASIKPVSTTSLLPKHKDQFSAAEAEFMPKTEAERKAVADEAASILAENDFDNMMLGGEVAAKHYKNSKNAFSDPSSFKFR